MSRLKTGIIGFGRIGAEHAGWITATTLCEVVAVHDPTPQRAAAARARGLPTVELLSMLEDTSVDAVLVSTPTSMHFDHARLCIEHGKHVMIEKPMALTHADCVELKRLADARGVKLCVFHCRRWDVDFLAARVLIESGLLGRVFNVESRLHQWASCVGPAAKEFRPGWRNEASFGGGGLFDWGSHFVDQLWQLLLPARPVSVFATLRSNVWSTDADDFARVNITFDNGAVGLCEINTTTTRPMPRWHIDGTAGSADAPSSLEFDTRRWAQFVIRLADGSHATAPPVGPGLSEADIWDRFAGSIRGECPTPIEIETVLTTMRILDAARESSRSGLAVAFDPATV
jgi:scyllo-inositol 2-dehydrogenase (NADP+)